ncbi:ribosome recycling factor [Neoactinobaculum massilliense]|uniref:ribosome recycling factor n=1 Tax=Neoactinobaculum massilliense TaxID=2364794 RepID=UPI000F527D05|nr:ribosome recycling factor [Neoactinobaculum massilliense]
MAIQEIIDEAREKMGKAEASASEDFGGIQSGRASAGMFNPILVDYYGTPTPLQQLATIAIPEPRTVNITPFDPGAKKSIEKALAESNLGVSVADDGQHLRVNLPMLTEERRKEYVKMARNRAEEGRVAVRGVRRKAMDALAKLQKDGDEGEDAVKRGEAEVDKLTKAATERIDHMLEVKEKDLLEI